MCGYSEVFPIYYFLWYVRSHVGGERFFPRFARGGSFFTPEIRGVLS